MRGRVTVVILGVAVGLLLSLLSLLPGLHLASLMMGILPLMWGGDMALAVAATLVGSCSMLHILHKAYHPVARSMLGGAEAATQLAYEGRGPAVVEAHRQAVITAAALVVAVGGLCSLVNLGGVNPLETMAGLVKPAMPWILLGVLALICLQSRRPVVTAIITLAAGLLGFMSFQLPALQGNHWAMAPLLGGLFALPASVALLTAPAAMALPEQRQGHWNEVPEIDITGSIIGMITGFLAGVGTGSLVTLFQPDDTIDRLALDSSADAANALFAMVAFSLMGTTRSGDAAALAAAAPDVDAIGALMCCGLLGVGVWVGGIWLKRLEAPYRELVHSLPQRGLGLGLTVVHLGLVVSMTGLAGVLIMLAGWAISAQARKWHVPNQALMATLIGPVLIYHLGWTGMLKQLLIA